MTVALTVLALPMAPVMHVNWVALVTLTEPQFMPPIETVAPDANPVPVRVIVVPPVFIPWFGEIEDNVGGTGVTVIEIDVLLLPAAFVAVIT